MQFSILIPIANLNSDKYVIISKTNIFPWQKYKLLVSKVKLKIKSNIHYYTEFWKAIDNNQSIKK